MEKLNRNQLWSEEDSEIFARYGHIFVPAREKQWKVMVNLLRALPPEVEIVELGCGTGDMARYLLESLPDARYTGLDLSEVMLEKTNRNVASFRDRVQLGFFELGAKDWRSSFSADVCISSLVIHHLDGLAKEDLFKDIFRMLSPGGLFLIADIVLPVRQVALELAAGLWDDYVLSSVEKIESGPDVFDFFKKAGWNFFDDPDADPIDKPSGLYEQLRWLDNAGFKGIDVFWMDAGHAIFGGWK